MVYAGDIDLRLPDVSVWLGVMLTRGQAIARDVRKPRCVRLVSEAPDVSDVLISGSVNSGTLPC